MRTKINSLFHAFIDPSEEEYHHAFSLICLGFLFFFGLLLWGIFLNFGEIPFDFHDWAEVNAPRLAFLKDAITKGQLPLHMPDSSALRGVTDRYMALPDVILSPQVILLRWLSVGMFVMVDTWLLYALGFWGLLKLRSHFELSLLSFSWIFLLFNFNGHILAHYAVGHITWGGYFLFPWFILSVFQLLDGRKGWRWTSGMAFLLFAVFLQGSFHQFVWCVIFLGFLAVSNFKLFFPILKAGIAASLLCAVRILPPAMQMGAFDDDFLGGYRTPLQILNALAKIISPQDSLNQKVTGAVLGWWEFDLFIGVIGVVFFIIALLCWLNVHQRNLGFPQLLCPLLILSIFSFRDIYAIFRKLQIPLFSGERVSARFLIVPVIFLLVIMTAALQRRLKQMKNGSIWNGLLCFSLIPLVVELMRNLSTWKVTEAVKAFPYTYTNLSIKVVSNHQDSDYTTALWIGLSISLVTALLLTLFSLIESEKQKKSQRQTAG